MDKEEFSKEKFDATFDMAKSHLKLETERVAHLDSKLNFILVFLAGLIAGLNIIFPLTEDPKKQIASIVLLIEFFCMVFSSGIMVLIGMYPKQNALIDADNFCDVDLHSKPYDEFMGRYIATLKDSIKSYQRTNAKKATCMKVSFILSIIAFVLLGILLLLKTL